MSHLIFPEFVPKPNFKLIIHRYPSNFSFFCGSTKNFLLNLVKLHDIFAIGKMSINKNNEQYHLIRSECTNKHHK